MFYPNLILFDDQLFTLLLDVDQGYLNLSDLSEMADNNGFDKKDEFHITVIGFKGGSIFREAIYGLPEAERSDMLMKIKDLIEETDWGFEIEPRCYHVSKVIESKTKTEKS